MRREPFPVDAIVGVLGVISAVGTPSVPIAIERGTGLSPMYSPVLVICDASPIVGLDGEVEFLDEAIGTFMSP
jgi:hypothetical protein